jgi:hypothetical protein
LQERIEQVKNAKIRGVVTLDHGGELDEKAPKASNSKRSVSPTRKDRKKEALTLAPPENFTGEHKFGTVGG